MYFGEKASSSESCPSRVKELHELEEAGLDDLLAGYICCPVRLSEYEPVRELLKNKELRESGRVRFASISLSPWIITTFKCEKSL